MKTPAAARSDIWKRYSTYPASWYLNIAAILVICGAATLFGPAGLDRLTRSQRRSALLWTAMGCWAGFLMIRASAPLGRHIPKLDLGIFSWRMLAITTLMAALLVG